MTELLDNNHDDHYTYLVGIVTGWWRHAGTSANVYMYLRGSGGQSARHAMRGVVGEHFVSGQEDWFVLRVAACLGELESITVWHDNAGQDPAWYDLYLCCKLSSACSILISLPIPILVILY